MWDKAWDCVIIISSPCLWKYPTFVFSLSVSTLPAVLSQRIVHLQPGRIWEINSKIYNSLRFYISLWYLNFKIFFLNLKGHVQLHDITLISIDSKYINIYMLLRDNVIGGDKVRWQMNMVHIYSTDCIKCLCVPVDAKRIFQCWWIHT